MKLIDGPFFSSDSFTGFTRASKTTGFEVGVCGADCKLTGDSDDDSGVETAYKKHDTRSHNPEKFIFND